MDLIDYDGIFKYKLIVPIFYIASWGYLIFGPIFFMRSFQTITCVITGYMMLRSVHRLIIYFLVGYRTIKTLQEDRHPNEDKQQPDIYHAFIIPNYKEDLELLADSIRLLASHSRAKFSYLIFLAMQAHQKQSTNKALQLVDSFKSCFKLIDYTSHVLGPNEVKGKASNQNWCARRLQDVLKKNKIQKDQVLVTVIDADSWVPSLYIDKVEDYLQANRQKKDTVIFVPPQIFSRNHLEVPVFSRVLDEILCFLLNYNLISMISVVSPFSNYSISLSLLEQIGFWDTCEDAIHQDSHLTFKANWKTKGNVQSVSIYVPFNQVCLQTGEGYLADWQAKYVQMLRVSASVVNIAYNFNMIIKTKWYSIKSCLMTIAPFEMNILFAIFPLISFLMLLQNFTLSKSDQTPTYLLSKRFFQIAGLIQCLCLFLTYIWKRYVNTKLYKSQNDCWLRFFEIIILVQFSIVLIYPISVIAVFGTLFSGKEHHVSEKHLKRLGS